MKFRSETTRLTLPADIDYLPALQGFVEQVAVKGGFTRQDVLAIQLGVEEAVTNVIKHAFLPDEQADYDVTLQLTPLALEIVVTEKGLPFDPGAVPEYEASADKLVDGSPEGGLGILLMRRMMDEVGFRNLGREGKELRMVKHLPQPDMSEQAPVPTEVHDEKDSPSVGEYLIRQVEISEAVKVAQLVYNCYGYTYFYERLYHPDQISELLRQGIMASVGAFTPDGELVGHLGMFRNESIGAVGVFGSGDDGRIGEPAVGVVHPGHRGQSLLPRLFEGLLQRASSFFPGLTGLLLPPVTTHTFSQKSVYGIGCLDCGNLVGYYPPVNLKNIDDIAPQRISLVLTFKPVGPMEERVLYPPAKHRDIIADIYANLGIKAAYRESRQDAEGERGNETRLTVKTVAELDNATIKIISYGPDTLQQVRSNVKALHKEGVEAVLCYLGLRDPLTPFMAERFEDMGFFFTGVLPETAQGDSMLMMHLDVEGYDTSEIHLMTDKGKEYLNYIERNMRGGGL
jgi:anti-sigma regulatory factor (Ser/Thr protein kinase)